MYLSRLNNFADSKAIKPLMKIARNIADLLFEHECVVIPGLGGFITKDHPASIHPVKHQFKPPHKEIVFNQHLRANDGMLLNYIAQKEALSYADAKKKMDKFVLRCLDEMEQGRKITFRNIGSIHFDSQKQIVFDVDQAQNYLADSFGLTGFVSPAIKREDFSQKLEQSIRQQREDKQQKLHTQPEPKRKRKQSSKQPTQAFKASRRANPYKKQLVFIGVLLLFMMIGWTYMNKHTVSRYYAAYSGWIPFFYASPNEFVASNADKLPVGRFLTSEQQNKDTQVDFRDEVLAEKSKTNAAEETVLIESAPVDAVDNPKETEALPATEPEVEVSAPITTNPTEKISQSLPEVNGTEEAQETGFFIIAGAFREKSNAEMLIVKLRQKGFEAQYAGQTNTGLWRVAFEVHQQRSAALRRLEIIKSEENAGAWIFSF